MCTVGTKGLYGWRHHQWRWTVLYRSQFLFFLIIRVYNRFIENWQNICMYIRYSPIENNRGRIGGRWWATVVLRGALPAAHRGGVGEMSALSLSRPTEDCAPLISYGSTVAHEEVPTINLPWWFYRGVLVGISGSGPPPLYAYYNPLLPTIPHDIPPARPLRFSIGSYNLGCVIKQALESNVFLGNK